MRAMQRAHERALQDLAAKTEALAQCEQLQTKMLTKLTETQQSNHELKEQLAAVQAQVHDFPLSGSSKNDVNCTCQGGKGMPARFSRFSLFCVSVRLDSH